MGSYGFSRFQVGCLLFQVGSHGFSRLQVVFSWFQVGFHGFSRFKFCFFMVSCCCFFSFFLQVSRLVFHGFRWVLRVIDGFRSVFIVPGWFLMVPGRFVWFSRFQVGLSCFFYGSSSRIYDSLKVPSWIKSKLSAGGAK